ncbi:unnamed protein product [Penicillium glandicola]
MSINFSSLRPGESQRAAAYVQARSKVIAAINEIYKRVEIYSFAQINPESYKFLGINCRLLELDDDGKHLYPPNSDPSSPVFFEPRGATWVAPVVPNPKYVDRLREITEEWEGIKDHPLVRNLHAQASHIFSCVEWMFFQFRRQFYPLGDGRVSPNLRQMSKWLESEELLRIEVMTITAVMITRLEGEESTEYNTFPVMVITFFGQMKARVLEAHSSQQELIIKKTQLLDFSTNEVANKNMNILLGFMADDLVGDRRS